MKKMLCSSVVCRTPLTESNCTPSVWSRGHGYCKVCSHAHKRTAAQNAALLRYMDKRYAKRRAAVDGIKLRSGCVDCGYRGHPAALQFDHVDPKTKSFKISGNVGRKWSNVIKEIKKCVIRCANCHVIRTVTEGHSKKEFLRSGLGNGSQSGLNPEASARTGVRFVTAPPWPCRSMNRTSHF